MKKIVDKIFSIRSVNIVGTTAFWLLLIGLYNYKYSESIPFFEGVAVTVSILCIYLIIAALVNGIRILAKYDWSVIKIISDKHGLPKKTTAKPTWWLAYWGLAWLLFFLPVVSIATNIEDVLNVVRLLLVPLMVIPLMILLIKGEKFN